MSSYDLRHIQVAEHKASGPKPATVTYGAKVSAGNAMKADLQFKFAEGRLYSEGGLSVYKKKITGGTMTITTETVPDEAAQLMFGARATSRTLTGAGQETVTGLAYGASNKPKYVGCSFYTYEATPGADKYTCLFVKKCLFGAPSMSMTTNGQNIQFSSPVSSGEFLCDDTAEGDAVETAICDSEAAAIAWCDEVFNQE